MGGGLRVRIGNGIRRVRTERGLSQSKLATMIGCEKTLITNYESGRRTPSIDRIESLATAMSVDVSELLRTEGGSHASVAAEVIGRIEAKDSALAATTVSIIMAIEKYLIS